MSGHVELEQLKKRFSPREQVVLRADPQVLAARFSPCGKFLVAGGYDGRCRRWDVSSESPVELSPVEGHRGWTQAIAFLAAESVVFTGDSWGQLRSWSYDQQDPVLYWQNDTAHDGWIRDLAVSPDGKLLASCGRDETIRLWSVEDGKKIYEWKGHGQDIYCVRFHPSGQWLLSGDSRGVVKQWEVSSGTCSREFDARVLYTLSRLQDVGGVKVLAFDSQGSTLAVGGTTPKNGGTVQGTPTILLFDFSTGQLKSTLTQGSANDCYVHDIHLHGDGFVMAVTCGTPGQGTLFFRRPEDNEPFFATTKMANTQSLSVHPDGKRLAVVATNPGSNGNGRQLKNGEYVGNHSPIYILTMEGGG